jgi:FAD/FMN-containing dehydrogenase
VPPQELLADLRAIVGDEGLLSGERLAARKFDEYVGCVAAPVLVRPADTGQVSAVLRLCHARTQPVLPHGGLTGLVFGATARSSELILSLEALNRIESVDVAGRTMRVEAGVRLQHAQKAADSVDLMFVP